MAATLGHVEPFDLNKDDWSRYTERLGQFFVANDVKDDAKVAVFLTVIGSKAYNLLHSLLAPEVPSSKKYEELVAVLGEHLNPKPLVIAERFKFHHRNQKEGERVAQYMAALRKLTEFEDYLEEALRDRLVCGLRNEAVQRRLLSEKDLRLQTAYDIAVSMETASRQASELQASSKTAAGQPYKDIGRVSTDGAITTTTTNSAWKLSQVWEDCHHPDKCFYRLQKCRSCGKMGHIARVCRKKGAFHRTSRPNAAQTKPPTSASNYVEQDTHTTVSESQDVDVSGVEIGALFTIPFQSQNWSRVTYF